MGICMKSNSVIEEQEKKDKSDLKAGVLFLWKEWLFHKDMLDFF